MRRYFSDLLRLHEMASYEALGNEPAFDGPLGMEAFRAIPVRRFTD